MQYMQEYTYYRITKAGLVKSNRLNGDSTLIRIGHQVKIVDPLSSTTPQRTPEFGRGFMNLFSTQDGWVPIANIVNAWTGADNTQDLFSYGLPSAKPDYIGNSLSIQSTKISQDSFITGRGKYGAYLGFGVQYRTYIAVSEKLEPTVITYIKDNRQGKYDEAAAQNLVESYLALIALSQQYNRSLNSNEYGATLSKAFGLLSKEFAVNVQSHYVLGVEPVINLSNGTLDYSTSKGFTVNQKINSTIPGGDISSFGTAKLATKSESIYSSGYSGSGSGPANSYSVSYSPSTGFSYSGPCGPGYGGMPSGLSSAVSSGSNTSTGTTTGTSGSD